MKEVFIEALDKYRVSHPFSRSSFGDGYRGCFEIPCRFKVGKDVFFIVSTGPKIIDGWEHVSASIKRRKRCPTWEEMCWLKNIFWEKSECVLQFHPPESDYVNKAPYCLHLWKPPYDVILPDNILV